jgi:hypothetical protein
MRLDRLTWIGVTTMVVLSASCGNSEGDTQVVGTGGVSGASGSSSGDAGRDFGSGGSGGASAGSGGSTGGTAAGTGGGGASGGGSGGTPNNGGPFDCGLQQCVVGSSYCYSFVPGVPGGSRSYECRTFEAACEDTTGCSCLCPASDGGPQPFCTDGVGASCNCSANEGTVSLSCFGQ